MVLTYEILELQSYVLHNFASLVVVGLDEWGTLFLRLLQEVVEYVSGTKNSETATSAAMSPPQR